jgi:REP element-mobilizing transposase RayT
MEVQGVGQQRRGERGDADALPRHAIERREQRLLDMGAGACYLAQPAIATAVADALQYSDGQLYGLFCWCIMPNYVHVVLRPLHEHTLGAILHTWKSYTAKETSKRLKRQGPFWQCDS